MKKLFLIILAAMGCLEQTKSQCPQNAQAFESTYAQCPLGCGVVLQGWPEGVIVNIYGGFPISLITSVQMPGVYGGSGVSNAFVCVPCDIPLIFASIIPGASNGCVIIPLFTTPLKLSDFSLKVTDRTNCIVKWTTYNESAGITYTVQRSRNSGDFKDIAILTGKGNSINSYQFIDNIIDPGTYYFRIKITEITGNITYSEIAMTKNQSNLGVSIYPNPAENDFKITIPNQFLPATIIIYNLQGKAINTTTMYQPTLSINKRFAKGIYAIRITGNNHASITQSLLIK